MRGAKYSNSTGGIACAGWVVVKEYEWLLIYEIQELDGEQATDCQQIQAPMSFW